MASLPDYAELHCLSNFSFQRGASHPEELVERARSGDRHAFRQLFVTHRNQVARVIQRLVPANEVEDVVQDVFLHVHRSLGSFRGDARFSTWLFRLALNVARMHVRRGRSRPKLTLAGDSADPHLERSHVHTPASESERRWRRSSRRPGVATSRCAALASRVCFSKPTPP